MTRRIILLTGLIALMYGMRALPSVMGSGADTVRGATIALGFLLLAAFIAGELTARLGVPRVTGYIVLGLLVGPSVLGLVTQGNLLQFRLINDIAISLIALAAGGELKISELRERGRSMGGILIFASVAVFIVIAGGVLALSPVLPFTAGREFAAIGVIALMFGSLAIASSPTVAIAVITDTRSRGPVTSTILGVTVLKDVVVIIFFAIALSVARALLIRAGGLELDLFYDLAWEIGGSILIGAISGAIISLYLSRVGTNLVLFILAIAFLNAELAAVFNLEVLVLSLTAGFFVENISPTHGEPFVEGLEANALPLYALFFALAGATVHLDELAVLWPFALAFVAARAAATLAGTWIGAKVTDAEPQVRRYAWLGFISQAGVTLGMVIIAARAFPEWGGELRTLFVSMVAIHEFIGPIVLQYALDKSGEIGKRDEARGGDTEVAEAQATA